MSEKAVGVLGATGRVGMECLGYLAKHCKAPLLAGGRKRPRDLAALHGADFMRVDVFDPRQLGDFCRRCRLVINCVGPAALVKNRVGEAALRHDCNFVDAGGYTPLHSALDADVVSGKGLRFLLALGILPGLSEIFPPYVAEKEFDQVEAMRYAVIGRDAWTPVSAYDIAWGVGNIGKGEGACHYENGRRLDAGVLGSSVSLRLPPPVGKHRLFRLMREDMREFVEANGIPHAAVYGNNWGVWVTLATVGIRIARLYKTDRQLRLAAKLIVAAAKLDMRGKQSGFMLHLHMEGRTGGGRRALARTLYFTDTYRATGICAAVGARLVLEEEMPPGIYRGGSLPVPLIFMRHFLAQGYQVTSPGDALDVVPAVQGEGSLS